jgi:ABC-type multidrug transport system ATPase subunit
MQVENLTKTYGTGFTLGPVSCSFDPGQTVGILGKNGAGKSTFFELLTGNMDATTGSITMSQGRLTPDRPDLKRLIGYLPQNPVLPKWVTANEILSYSALLHELSDSVEKVKDSKLYWDCEGYASKPIATLSYGMQKRVGLALATLHNPDILILDEPHSGLDLFHVRALDEAIQDRKKQGKTTIISTHVSSFAAAMCDRLHMIDRGELKLLDGWQQLSFMDRMAAIDVAFFGKGNATC